MAAAVACCAVQNEDGPTSDSWRAKLAAKQNEAAALRAGIQRAELEVQQLRLRLQAQTPGASGLSLVPAKFQAGTGSLEPPQHFELRAFLQWLTEAVDLSRQVIFECGAGEGEVEVSGRRVLLRRMAAWTLGGASWDGLKLSVPLDLQPEIAAMLVAAQARGRVEEAMLQRISENWEMVGAEVVSSGTTPPEPAIFLVHRETSQAITVTQWPHVNLPVGEPPCVSSFDPAQHFTRSPAKTPVQVAQKPEASPKDAATTVGINQRKPSISMGDRVEVEYEGHWFSGVLERVDGDLANVKCDVDSPGVVTVAPFTSIRPERPVAESPPRRVFRHARGKSTG